MRVTKQALFDVNINGIVIVVKAVFLMSQMKFTCVLFGIIFRVGRIDPLAWGVYMRSVTSQLFKSADDFINIGSHRPRFPDGHTLRRARDGLKAHRTPVKVNLLEPEDPKEDEHRPDLPIDTSRRPF